MNEIGFKHVWINRHSCALSGIPPSITGLVVAMRSQTHSFTDNRELYLAGGSTSDQGNVSVSHSD